MEAYFIAQLSIHDKNEYEKYLEGFDAIFEKYNGKVLAVDPNPEVLEGVWNHDRFVIIQFPSELELKNWYKSDEYQNLAKYRFNASNGDVFVVKGKE